MRFQDDVFAVRFGKYSSFRAKDRTVRIFVNGDVQGTS